VNTFGDIQMDNYVGLHQRHEVMVKELRLHQIEGAIMAVVIILTPMIAVFVIGLFTGL
jgi:hypothetical protein